MSAIIVNNIVKHFELPKRGRQKRMGPDGSQKTMNIIRAVDDISFEVRKGEIFGFLGPNGAGKTTTIRMMTGVLRPTEGKIKILGLDAWKNQIAVKQMTGNVPEMANVYFSFSGWENLMFIGEIYGISKKERIAKAESLLKKFDLYEKRTLKTKKYSKGMKQRLLLCMALMTNPQILFLDEPTAGLDVQSSKIIKDLIREYNEHGVTIFLTTHDMDVANELCDRIAIINHGKIISLDTPENLKKLTQDYQAIDLQFVNGVNKQEIKNLRNIREVQETQDGVHVIVEDIHESICELVDYIKTQNIKIKQLSTHIPKLEEAFLKIIERGGSND
ncbi:MAG: ATP-binding cassette domain-containing protein [Candidatus Lokiarchaeota archaeon]|nr:ATP-binding cassette domain-containing protein [Candidatus Lokiarchaeota archaeon]